MAESKSSKAVVVMALWSAKDGIIIYLLDSAAAGKREREREESGTMSFGAS